MPSEPEDIVMSPIMGDVLTAMFSQSANINNRVQENNEREIARLTAELSLVRGGIESLIYGKYQPTTHALEEALYPSEYEIEAQIEKKKESF